MYNNKQSNVVYMWTACISIFQEHNCKEWFGGPTQVWTKTVVDMHYRRLPSILCHVAICETEIDFEQIGKAGHTRDTIHYYNDESNNE